MAYLIDRQRALPGDDLVAVLSVRRHRVRSIVIMRDNSLYQSLTRSRTFIDRARAIRSLVWTRCGGARRAREKG